MKQRILMVCLGNICRSPLAEGLLRHHLQLQGKDHIEVDSAGTSDYHVGEQPDTRTIQNAATHKVDISSLRARQFHAADFESFDRIFVMDASNYQNVSLVSKNTEQMAKVDFLLNVLWENENRAVPDPYFGGPDGFEQVFQLVNKACEVLAAKL